MENLVRLSKKLLLLGLAALFAFEFSYLTIAADVEPLSLEIARLIFALGISSLIPALALQWVAQRLIAVPLHYGRAYLLAAANLLLFYSVFRRLQAIRPPSTQIMIAGAVAYLVVTTLLYANAIRQPDGGTIGYWRGFKLVAIPVTAVVLTVGAVLLVMAFCIVGGIGGQM